MQNNQPAACQRSLWFWKLQVLTKRVARLPANLPFEMKSADEPALQRLAAGVGARSTKRR